MYLTREEVQEVFDYSEGNLIYKKGTCHNSAGTAAGSITGDGRLEVWCKNKHHLVHRLIFLYHHGHLPDIVDHIDQDYTNNKIENLREATKSENNHNSSVVRSATGYRGVIYAPHIGKYRARLIVEGKRYECGYWETAEAAGGAYLRLKKELCPYVSYSE